MSSIPECGTMQAVWRHLRLRESPLDERCRKTRLQYQAELRERHRDAARGSLPPHGTVERYRIHRARGTAVCEECRSAQGKATGALDEGQRLAEAHPGPFLKLLLEAGGDRELALQRLRKTLLDAH